jgi:hypothetical protein
MSSGLFFRRLLVVIKQTAYEEYSQVCFVFSCVAGLWWEGTDVHPSNNCYHRLSSFLHCGVQLKLRGQAPKALRWARLESRYHSHKECVETLLSILKANNVAFSCVNRVELDRQHLTDVDLMIAIGGDGTVLSAAHFLDHGTIPLLGINSDPISEEDK